MKSMASYNQEDIVHSNESIQQHHHVDSIGLGGNATSTFGNTQLQEKQLDQIQNFQIEQKENIFNTNISNNG